MIGVKCPKCGLMQMARPTCKSCDSALDGPVPRHTPAQASAARPISPSSRPGGPIYRTEEPPPFMAPEGPPYATQEPPRFQEPPPFMVQESPPYAPSDDGLYSGPETLPMNWLIFHGKGGSLFGIKIVNMLLTLLTLGIYHFWGKVRVRSYILSQTEFGGDRFAYHGTGKELLVGFLKAVVIFGIPLFGLVILPELTGASEAAKSVGFFIAYGLAFVVIPLAMVGARRYRLSRTSWRGIRFSFRGSAKDFVKLFIKGSFLSGITGGLYYPYFETQKFGFMTSHSYFGNEKFHFDGEGRDLFGPYLLAVLLFLPTLGLYYFWFQAKKHRYFWENTSIGNARFRSTVTGGALLMLTLGNFLLLILTLGFAWPWVVVRNIQFTFRYLNLEGAPDMTQIAQQAQFASPTGEGLASFLDLDTGFDFG